MISDLIFEMGERQGLHGREVQRVLRNGHLPSFRR